MDSTIHSPKGNCNEDKAKDYHHTVRTMPQTNEGSKGKNQDTAYVIYRHFMLESSHIECKNTKKKLWTYIYVMKR